MESIEIAETGNLTFYRNTTFYVDGTSPVVFMSGARNIFSTLVFIVFPTLIALSMTLCVCSSLVRYANLHNLFMREYSPPTQNETGELSPDREASDASSPRHSVDPASVPFSQA